MHYTRKRVSGLIPETFNQSETNVLSMTVTMLWIWGTLNGFPKDHSKRLYLVPAQKIKLESPPRHAFHNTQQTGLKECDRYSATTVGSKLWLELELGALWRKSTTQYDARHLSFPSATFHGCAHVICVCVCVHAFLCVCVYMCVCECVCV